MFALICESFPGFGNLVQRGAEFRICRILRKPAAFTSLPAIFHDPLHRRNSVIGHWQIGPTVMRKNGHSVTAAVIFCDVRNSACGSLNRGSPAVTGFGMYTD